MLICNRGIPHISRITRYAYPHGVRLQKFKLTGDIGKLRHLSNANLEKSSKRQGTTIKIEECTVPKDINKSSSCPPPLERNSSCPPSCEEICGKIPPKAASSGGEGGDSNNSQYWKHIIATLLIAGITIYAYAGSDWIKNKNESQKKGQSPKKKKESSEINKKEKTRYPINSTSIPEDVPYLLIGGGTAAFSAFRAIKSRDPKAKVLVVTDEPDYPYMRPPLSKELWYNKEKTLSGQLRFKQWNGTERSLFYEPAEFYASVDNLVKSDKGGVAVATGWKVKTIDPFSKVATLDDGYEIKYDKCLIATGASPQNLSIFDNADELVKSKIVPFRTKDDFLELAERLTDSKVKNIVIIGGGLLGSELACSLARNYENNQKNIYQIYKEKFILSQVLPEYLSEWTTKKSIIEGVNCLPNAEISNYEMKNNQLILQLTNGKKIEADQVVVAIGVKANTDLAKTANLEIDPEIGGFLVNAELEARSNLWVAGDAACFYDIKLGRRRVEHHDHAVISGRLAGENMTGARKPYTHQSMFWSDLGPDVGYEAIGIVDSSLPTVGIFAKTQNENHSNENINSQSSETTPENNHSIKQNQDYGRGIIFYLRNDTVVGIVLWNIFNRMSLARQVLARETHYDDLNEISKLFTIHEE